MDDDRIDAAEPGDPAPPRIDEAPGDRLVEAGVPQQVLDPADQDLMAPEAADRAAAAGKGGRQVLVEPVDAGDLLDQVDLAGDVEMPVGRHGDGERAAVGTGMDGEAESIEVLGGALGLDLHAEQGVDCGPAGRSGRTAPSKPSRASTSIVPGTSRAPQSSTISFDATRCARIARSGWSCFSNRVDASERRASRLEVRRMLVPFQVATSSSTRVVVSETSET